MNIQQKLGQRLRELRKRTSLTQAELAVRCGKTIEMQRIGEIERGERNATLQTIDRLAKALKVEPAELFLFRPQQVGKSMSMLDARLVDLWKGADEKQRQKAVRVLSEIL